MKITNIIKKSFLLLLVFIFIFSLVGCQVNEKTFSGGGLEIKLTSDFKEVENALYDIYIINDQNVAFMSKRYTKHQTIQNVDLSTLTREEYMSFCIANYGWDATVFSVERPNEEFDSFCYCYYGEYNQTTGEYTYGYMMIVMSDENYFYNISLAVPYAKFQDSKQLLMEYAISIKVL